MAQINFSNSADNSFSPLPEGTADFEILKVEQGVSKKGNPQLVIDTEICSGDSEGKKTKMWYSLTPQSTWKLKKLLLATHTPFETAGEQGKGGTIQFDTDDLVGAIFTCDIEISINPENNKPKNDFNNERVSAMMAPPAQATMPSAVAAAPPPVTTSAVAAPPAVGAAPAPSFQRRSRA